jgi:hypothetical protein
MHVRLKQVEMSMSAIPFNFEIASFWSAFYAWLQKLKDTELA